VQANVGSSHTQEVTHLHRSQSSFIILLLMRWTRTPNTL